MSATAGDTEPPINRWFLITLWLELNRRGIEPGRALFGLAGERVAEDLSEMVRKEDIVRGIERLMGDEEMKKRAVAIREKFEDGFPASSKAALDAFVGADDTGDIRGRDIKIETREGQLLNISDCAGYYDPLQYPLLLPYGTYGWDINSRSSNGRPMTCRAYYAYVLQIRLNEDSVLLRGGRLLQQYVVDNYVKIETQKLRYIRNNQPDLRCEFYNGLHDSLNAGEDNAGNIGRRIILPSTFIGSPRDMHQRYQDAMALVQKYGKPDIFLTMTCNPNWDEIKAELLPGQTSQDRPDLCTRIFRAKLENLKEEVIKKGVLGKVIVYVYVIEFQKRGLPHAHMLLMLHDDDKLNNPDDYDKIVRAELPDQNQEPQLYDVVLRHMIHGSCGTYKPNSPCMKGGNCKRGYPKPFSMNTFQGNDSYPNYRRRDIHLNANVDNRWDDKNKAWKERQTNQKVIGRIYTVSPSEGEKFYLRVLLNHVRGPKSYEDLRTVNDILHPTFKKAAEQRGLLEDDDSIRKCLQEASTIRMPSSLRRLFATILIHCEPHGVRDLWDQFYQFMIEDYTSSSAPNNAHITNRLLRDLNELLAQHSKSISDYDLPQMTRDSNDGSNLPRLIQDEVSIITPQQDYNAVHNLNQDQTFAYNTIISAIERNDNVMFFVDGPGGTGKTYLYRALLATLRNKNHIVLATATSGIAATILPGGRTAHSRFKIPLDPEKTPTCSISKQSDLAELIRKSSAIICDEAPMMHKCAFEALNETLKDITKINLPFGGKVIIFGGDFRQIPPVVPKDLIGQLKLVYTLEHTVIKW
ncbi:hypothetical protein ACLB2K_018783 [Fragaria x ananassa]